MSNTLKNLVFLGTMQATNYLVPIIIIPILLERIGLEKYGIIVFAQGICTIAVAITDYGLNLTGTRDISQNLDDTSVQRTINSNILWVRIILLIGGFVILCLLTLLFPRWQEESLVILTSYVIVVAQSLLPQWFFEGVQKMHFLTLLTFLSRVSYLLSIVFLIDNGSDYVFVNLLNGLSWLLCSFFGLAVVFRKVGFPRLKPNARAIGIIFKVNAKIFVSNLIAAAYRSGPVLIAGSFFTPANLGVYGVLDKVISLINTSGVIIFRSIFPGISEEVKRGNPNAIKRSWVFLKKITILAIPLCILLALLGPQTLAAVSEKIQANEVKEYFYFIGLLPVMVLFNLRFTLPLLAFDLKQAYLQFNLSGFIALLLVAPLASYHLGIHGLLSAIIITEAGMIGTGTYLLKKAGIYQL